MEEALTLERARHLVASLVRGDALIGILPDARAASEAMMQDLWRIAPRAPEAFALLGRGFYAVLVPDGAFDGVYEGGTPDVWPEESLFIEEENPAVEAALRCFFLAAKRGQLAQVRGPLVDLGVHSTPENAAIVLGLLEDEPIGARDVYQRGLLLHAAGRSEEAAAWLRRAADAGDANAMFDLSIFAAEGIGSVIAEESDAWLERAAEHEHPRALHNLGAAWASGARGVVDYAKAAAYYTRSADAGYGKAAATLAVMILLGQLDGSPEQAAVHLSRAEEHGFDPAPMLDAVGLRDPRA